MQDLFSPTASIYADLAAQVPGKPFKPATARLRAWLSASYAHYYLRLGENSISYAKAPEIREVWRDLLMEAADAGCEEPPVTLLAQAAEQVGCTMPKVRLYDILVHTGTRLKWERSIRASCLSEAAKVATSRHKNSTMKLGWFQVRP